MNFSHYLPLEVPNGQINRIFKQALLLSDSQCFKLEDQIVVNEIKLYLIKQQNEIEREITQIAEGNKEKIENLKKKQLRGRTQ